MAGSACTADHILRLPFQGLLPDGVLFALKPGDYFDALATWLNIISNQNHNAVSLIKEGGVRKGEELGVTRVRSLP